MPPKYIFALNATRPEGPLKNRHVNDKIGLCVTIGHQILLGWRARRRRRSSSARAAEVSRLAFRWAKGRVPLASWLPSTVFATVRLYFLILCSARSPFCSAPLPEEVNAALTTMITSDAPDLPAEDALDSDDEKELQREIDALDVFSLVLRFLLLDPSLIDCPEACQESAASLICVWSRDAGGRAIGCNLHIGAAEHNRKRIAPQCTYFRRETEHFRSFFAVKPKTFPSTFLFGCGEQGNKTENSKREHQTLPKSKQ